MIGGTVGGWTLRYSESSCASTSITVSDRQIAETTGARLEYVRARMGRLRTEADFLRFDRWIGARLRARAKRSA